MSQKNLSQWIASIFTGLAALACLALSLLPYPSLKHALALAYGGHFKSINDTNAIIFKILFACSGFLLGTAAFIIGSGRTQAVRAWLGRYRDDAISSLKSLKPARPDWIAWFILGLTVLLGAILRLPLLNAILTHDEAYTFVVFGHTSLFNIVSNYSLPNNHILNTLLIYITTHLLGIAPWAVRLPALLAGLLIIPATYLLAKNIYEPFTALASALMVAILPGAIIYATQARGYTLVGLFTLISLWLANAVIRERNRFAWSLLAIVMALGFYSVPVMLFPFGIVFLWMLGELLVGGAGAYQTRSTFLKYWLATGIATAVLVLLLYTPVFIYTGPSRVFANPWVTPSPWSGYLASLPTFLLATWHEWTDGLPAIVTVLILAGILLSLIFHRSLARQRFPLQAAAVLWLAALLLVQRPSEVTKIWAFLQAPVMIWASAGITGLLRALPNAWDRYLARREPFSSSISATAGKVAAGLPVALLLLFTAFGAITAMRSLPARWNDTGVTERVVQAIKTQMSSQDLIIVDSPYDSSIWYYALLNRIPEDRFDRRRPFHNLFVVVSPDDGQTLQSVLKQRAPDPSLWSLESSSFVANFQNLDIYEVPHR